MTVIVACTTRDVSPEIPSCRSLFHLAAGTGSSDILPSEGRSVNIRILSSISAVYVTRPWMKDGTDNTTGHSRIARENKQCANRELNYSYQASLGGRSLGRCQPLLRNCSSSCRTGWCRFHLYEPTMYMYLLIKACVSSLAIGNLRDKRGLLEFLYSCYRTYYNNVVLGDHVSNFRTASGN